MSQKILAYLRHLNETDENAPNKKYKAVFPYGVFHKEDMCEFLSMHEAKKTAYEVQSETEWFAKAELTVNKSCSLPKRLTYSARKAISDIAITVLKSKLWSEQSSHIMVGDLTAQQLSTLVCTDGSVRM